ncbi:hypothetical protein CEXT_68881 [Caerostris extrusa]|uniref:Uncharacterized protein n=1 Tax=Caerostris extrusa TaxID=172846 RepID=A0AAV4TI52_CAEEX|nr:hypothetical protein CEXT_68881 [Caerostris extrusa]
MLKKTPKNTLQAMQLFDTTSASTLYRSGKQNQRSKSPAGIELRLLSVFQPWCFPIFNMILLAEDLKNVDDLSFRMEFHQYI